MRFHPDASRHQPRETIADLVMLLHSDGVSPSLPYRQGPTGNLANAWADPKSVSNALKRLTERDWTPDRRC
jgi:hypothetical protein